LSRNRALKAQQQQQQNRRMPVELDNVLQFQTRKVSSRPVDLIPRTRNQESLVLALQDAAQHIVVTVGPAGTGKTYLAMLAAIKALKEGTCDRIVMTRPAVGVEGEQHGFLPGNLTAKMEPWTRPLLDVMREFYRPQDIVTMIEDQTVEIAPLAYMRGRTFKNAWIIADEMQNSTISQMKMLLTRLGENSTMVVTGDLAQADRLKDNGLIDFIGKIEGRKLQHIDVVRFDQKDIERHKAVAEVLNLYGDE
jgi:phosphate starvation-inducible PhoH-like protein